VPALPSSILEPLWVQVSALLPIHQVDHPLGCHRPRIPDRVIFDKLIQLLVFGCGCQGRVVFDVSGVRV
jgi:transposase